jgi:hypothetical protein
MEDGLFISRMDEIQILSFRACMVHAVFRGSVEWRARPDSNGRPADSKSDALSN